MKFSASASSTAMHWVSGNGRFVESSRCETEPTPSRLAHAPSPRRPSQESPRSQVRPDIIGAPAPVASTGLTQKGRNRSHVRIHSDLQPHPARHNSPQTPSWGRAIPCHTQPGTADRTSGPSNLQPQPHQRAEQSPTATAGRTMSTALSAAHHPAHRVSRPNDLQPGRARPTRDAPRRATRSGRSCRR